MEEQTKKHIAILGSTGSIGTQTLEVISEQSGSFCVEVLTAHNNADLLIEQSKKFLPNTVVIGDKSSYQKVKDALEPLDIKVFTGYEAIAQVVQMDTIDMVVTAMVGYSGLKPTISAIKAGKTIGLANKETLVVAGEYVMSLAREKGVNIFPSIQHSSYFSMLARGMAQPD